MQVLKSGLDVMVTWNHSDSDDCDFCVENYSISVDGIEVMTVPCGSFVASISRNEFELCDVVEQTIVVTPVIHDSTLLPDKSDSTSFAYQQTGTYTGAHYLVFIIAIIMVASLESLFLYNIIMYHNE